MVRIGRFWGVAGIVALTMLAFGCGPSHKEFASRMNSGDVEVRRSAAKELRGQPRKAKLVPVILQACRDEDESVRENAFYAMERVDPHEDGVVAAIIEGAADTSTRVRRAVIASMGKMNPFPNTCVPYMVRMLSDPDAMVRNYATSALADLEGGSVGSLMRSLDSKDAKLRLAVAGILGQIGSAAKPALTKLKRMAQEDEDDDVKEAAKKAVSYIER